MREFIHFSGERGGGGVRGMFEFELIGVRGIIIFGNFTMHIKEI